MVSIQVDETTALALERQAQEAGLSVADFLRTLLPATSATQRPKWDEIELQIEALSSPTSPLPADFSRADIYSQHD